MKSGTIFSQGAIATRPWTQTVVRSVRPASQIQGRRSALPTRRITVSDSSYSTSPGRASILSVKGRSPQMSRLTSSDLANDLSIVETWAAFDLAFGSIAPGQNELVSPQGRQDQR